jgi:hypothetical protein
MIDRLILGVALSVVGWNGLFPESPKPVTHLELRQKAKMQSISGICERKRKQKQSESVKSMCRRWEKGQYAQKRNYE